VPRRRRRSRLSLLYALVIGGLLVGSSVWLDYRGERVVAPVTAKRERITVVHEPQGSWDRWYEVGVGVAGSAGDPWVANVGVPRERYESLRVGDSIEVRYLPALPLFARTSDRSTATVAWEAAKRILGVPLLLWAAGGAAALWIAARVGTVAVLAGGVAWIAAGVAFLCRAPVPSAPSGAESPARVTAVTLVSKAPARGRSRTRSRVARSIRRLAVPYQVVQLQLVPRGRPDPVLVVDAVDSGSVRGLAVGAELPVRYDPAAPREARLAVGTRSFVERNRYHYLPIVLGLPLLGLLGGLAFRWDRRRRTRQPATRGSARLSGVPV